MKSSVREVEEISAFKRAKLWEDGFIDCDPTNPLTWSSYRTNGFVSIYYALGKAAIEARMPKGATVLEIGPGRGAWTKALFHWGAEKVIALDVQSREFNKIDDYLGDFSKKLEYYVVDDCSCSMIKDKTIDFVWSGGAFVHMSRSTQSRYFASFKNKMKPGAQGFVQYADFELYNEIVTQRRFQIHHLIADLIQGKDGEQAREIMERYDIIRSVRPQDMSTMKSTEIIPGRYYHVSRSEMSEVVRGSGLQLVSENFMPSFRDPVVHFRNKKNLLGRIFDKSY